MTKVTRRIFGITSWTLGGSSFSSTNSMPSKPINSGAVTRDIPFNIFTEDTIQTAGYSEATDFGGGTWVRVPQEPNHPGKGMDPTGAWFELECIYVYPEMFGARGDNHDDTIALQNAILYCTTKHKTLKFYRNKYTISSTLLIPGGSKYFSIISDHPVELIQRTDNTTHILFNGENSSNWQIRGLKFSWSNNQSPKHKLSYAIRFDTITRNNFGHRFFEISDCEFYNGFRGIGVDNTQGERLPCPIWSASFRRLIAGERHTGAILALDNRGVTGQPNILVEHVYARCDSMREPCLIFLGCDTLNLLSIELNKGTGRLIDIRYCRSVTVIGLRFEHTRLTAAGSHLIYCSGAKQKVTLQGLCVQSLDMEELIDGYLLTLDNSCNVRLNQLTTELDIGAKWRTVRVHPKSRLYIVKPERHSQISMLMLSDFDNDALRIAPSALADAVTLDGLQKIDLKYAGSDTPGLTGLAVRRGTVISITFAHSIITTSKSLPVTLSIDNNIVYSFEWCFEAGLGGGRHFLDSAFHSTGFLPLAAGNTITLSIPNSEQLVLIHAEIEVAP